MHLHELGGVLFNVINNFGGVLAGIGHFMHTLDTGVFGAHTLDTGVFGVHPQDTGVFGANKP
jgi:hypothetical protein